MNFGSTQSTSAAGLVRLGNHVVALLDIIFLLGFWVNKIVNKLLSKLNKRWLLSWLLQIHKFTMETAVSVLKKHLPLL